MGVSSCFWTCVCLYVDVAVGCVFVCGLEHYTFSPLSCLTVTLPRQTRQPARCLVETTPVCLQTTSNNADSLCTCQSVSQPAITSENSQLPCQPNICFHTHTHTPFIFPVSVSLSYQCALKYSLIFGVCVLDCSYQCSKVNRLELSISDGLRHNKPLDV